MFLLIFLHVPGGAFAAPITTELSPSWTKRAVDEEAVARNFLRYGVNPHDILTPVTDAFPDGRMYHGTSSEKAIRSMVFEGIVPAPENYDGTAGAGFYVVSNKNLRLALKYAKQRPELMVSFAVSPQAKILDLNSPSGKQLLERYLAETYPQGFAGHEGPKYTGFANAFGIDILRYPYNQEAFVVKNPEVIGGGEGYSLHVMTSREVTEFLNDKGPHLTLKQTLRFISANHLKADELSVIQKLPVVSSKLRNFNKDLATILARPQIDLIFSSEGSSYIDALSDKALRRIISENCQGKEADLFVSLTSAKLLDLADRLFSARQANALKGVLRELEERAGNHALPAWVKKWETISPNDKDLNFFGKDIRYTTVPSEYFRRWIRETLAASPVHSPQLITGMLIQISTLPDALSEDNQKLFTEIFFHPGELKYVLNTLYPPYAFNQRAPDSAPESFKKLVSVTAQAIFARGFDRTFFNLGQNDLVALARLSRDWKPENLMSLINEIFDLAESRSTGRSRASLYEARNKTLQFIWDHPIFFKSPELARTFHDFNQAAASSKDRETLEFIGKYVNSIQDADTKRIVNRVLQSGHAQGQVRCETSVL